jgi:hypothetical protein
MMSFAVCVYRHFADFLSRTVQDGDTPSAGRIRDIQCDLPGDERGLFDRILVVQAFEPGGVDQSVAVLHVEIIKGHIKVPPRSNAHPACSVPAPERMAVGILESGFFGVECNAVSAQKTGGDRPQGAVSWIHRT